MGILGITNRTEDWKTARSFAPFFTDDCRSHPTCQSAYSNRLERLTRFKGHCKIELFWKWDA